MYMDTNRRGFAPIAITLIVLAGIAVLGGAFYAYHQYNEKHVSGVIPPELYDHIPLPPITTSTPTSIPSSSTPIPPSKKPPLYPSSGPIGATVTINGSRFAATGNVVTLNGLSAGPLKDLSSPDGKTITFIVPQTLGPVCNKAEMCAQFLVEVTPGTAYTIHVVAPDGTTSQVIGTFTITGDSQGHLPL